MAMFARPTTPLPLMYELGGGGDRCDHPVGTVRLRIPPAFRNGRKTVFVFAAMEQGIRSPTVFTPHNSGSKAPEQIFCCEI